MYILIWLLIISVPGDNVEKFKTVPGDNVDN